YPILIGYRRSRLNGPVEDDLAAAAARGLVEGGLEVVGGVAAGDHRAEVETALQQDRHRVPGLEHLASVDALEGDHRGDDAGPVDGEVLGGQAEHGDLAAVGHVGDHRLQRLGATGHLQADV